MAWNKSVQSSLALAPAPALHSYLLAVYLALSARIRRKSPRKESWVGSINSVGEEVQSDEMKCTLWNKTEDAFERRYRHKIEAQVLKLANAIMSKKGIFGPVKTEDADSSGRKLQSPGFG